MNIEGGNLNQRNIPVGVSLVSSQGVEVQPLQALLEQSHRPSVPKPRRPKEEDFSDRFHNLIAIIQLNWSEVRSIKYMLTDERRKEVGLLHTPYFQLVSISEDPEQQVTVAHIPSSFLAVDFKATEIMARAPKVVPTPQEVARKLKEKAEKKALLLTEAEGQRGAPAGNIVAIARASRTFRRDKRSREEISKSASSPPCRAKKISKKTAVEPESTTELIRVEDAPTVPQQAKGKQTMIEKDPRDISILGWSEKWANNTNFEPDVLNFRRSSILTTDSDVVRHVREASQIPPRSWTMLDHENIDRLNPMDRLTMGLIMAGRSLNYLTSVEPQKLHSDEEIEKFRNDLKASEKKVKNQAIEIQTLHDELLHEKTNHRMLEGRFQDTEARHNPNFWPMNEKLRN